MDLTLPLVELTCHLICRKNTFIPFTLLFVSEKGPCSKLSIAPLNSYNFPKTKSTTMLILEQIYKSGLRSKIYRCPNKSDNLKGINLSSANVNSNLIDFLKNKCLHQNLLECSVLTVLV